MIFTLILLVSILALGTVFGSFNLKNYENGDGYINTKQTVKTLAVVGLSIVIASLQPVSVQKIDAGYVGLKIDKVGNEKGVPVAQPCKGWVWYNSWVTDVVEYSIRQNHVQYEKFNVTVKGGFPLYVEPSFNYSLKPEKASALYINLLKGGDFKDLEGNFLYTATKLSLGNASNKFPIDSLFNNKEGYNRAVYDELNKELSAYFIVTQINPGTIPPPELADVIKNKTQAVQKAQQAELDKITAQANAETQIATARGDSAATVINAKAAAEAIKLKTNEVSPTYVEYIKWLNADATVPRVPTTVLGSQSNVLYNPK